MIWTVLLVGAFAGWAVLDGMNQGLGATLRQVGRTPGERRTVLTALGPFLLAGEVWLVAAAGVLLAGFHDLERDLCSSRTRWSSRCWSRGCCATPGCGCAAGARASAGGPAGSA